MFDCGKTNSEYIPEPCIHNNKDQRNRGKVSGNKENYQDHSKYNEKYGNPKCKSWTSNVSNQKYESNDMQLKFCTNVPCLNSTLLKTDIN